MTKQATLVLVSLAAACVALICLASFATHPLLYSTANESRETEYHLNPDVLKESGINSTTDIYPLMEDMLDSSGDITMNIRIRDYDSAQAALADYQRYRARLDHLVVTLDMNQSDIDTFVKNSQTQGQIYQQLMNDTATLDALNDLEVRYQNSENPEMTASVKYQGAALRNRIHDTYQKYEQVHTNTTTISTRHGINSTKYTDSLNDVRAVDNEADAAYADAPQVQHMRAFNASTPFLTLAAYPHNVTYLDTIVLFGYLNIEDLSTPVAITLDNTTLVNITADDTEAYHGSILVESIPTGTHTLIAYASNLTSVPIPITVEPVNSSTTLSVKAIKGMTAALCTGTVTANHPVRYAPYTIEEGETILSLGTTDGKGAFNTTVPLFTGTHILTASYSSPVIPVNASRSPPQNVTITEIPGIAPGSSGTWFGTVIVWAAFVIILTLSVAGAYWYLNRTKTVVPKDPATRYGPIPDYERPEKKEPVKPTTLPARLEQAILSALKRETLATRYNKLLRSAGLSAAAHQVYRILAGRIAGKLGIGQFQTLTPREFTGRCTEKGAPASLPPFIKTYETIRYGGKADNTTRLAFEAAMTALDRELKGDRD